MFCANHRCVASLLSACQLSSKTLRREQVDKPMTCEPSKNKKAPTKQEIDQLWGQERRNAIKRWSPKGVGNQTLLVRSLIYSKTLLPGTVALT